MPTDPTPASPDGFLTTRWTRVGRAQTATADGLLALAELSEAYYRPVLTFLQFELRDAEAAQEMTQAFFVNLLSHGGITSANPKVGKFRSYLLGAVKHFLSHQRAFHSRLKRGGGHTLVSLDEPEATNTAATTRSPDAEFDRQWALTVLERAMESLRRECASEGKQNVFEQMQPLLSGDAAHGGQAAAAAACGMNVTAFRMALHRLKHRLRDYVKAEVAGTLEHPGMVQEEMQALFTALA